MTDHPLSLDNQLCFAVYRAQLAFSRAYRPLLEHLGVTYPQYLVLLVLWERGQARISEIGEILGLDSGTLSPLVQRLEKLGLTRRTRSEDDQRAVIVRLTAKGMGARKEALSVASGIMDAVGCPADEFIEFRGRLRRLTGNLDKAAARSA